MKWNRLSNICVLVIILIHCLNGYSQASQNTKNTENPSTYKPRLGKILPEIAKIAYAGDEKMRFDITWSGGIKLGELTLEVKKIDQCEECFEIDSIVSTQNGIIDAIYPVKDRHKTLVKGKDRLPYYCEIWQKQGRNYRAHKIERYDQEGAKIYHHKDGDTDKVYSLTGQVHNEFSAFYASRVMSLEINKPLIVPTFGDERRNEVKVQTVARLPVKNTIFEDVASLKVIPVLTFSGLYDKKGDTVIWFTDNECRVPVLVRSKIFIGALTATLAEYHNPACLLYNTQDVQK